MARGFPAAFSTCPEASLRRPKCSGRDPNSQSDQDVTPAALAQAAPFSQKTMCSMPGKAVRRRWSLDVHGIRRVGSKESGFTYQNPDGSPVSEKIAARIRALRIPPAWRNVRIARGESSPLQAVGIDKEGRTQYLYHSRFRAQREEEKFRRVVEFGESLPELRRRVRNDQKELFAFIDSGKIRDVKDRHVNDYIQSIIGDKFTAKDFRTWAGTLLCSIALAMEGQGASKKERKRKIKRAIEAASQQLGNTP